MFVAFRSRLDGDGPWTRLTPAWAFAHLGRRIAVCYNAIPMKNLAFVFLCLLSGPLLSANQMTVFNSYALMKFEKTSLQVRRFDFPDIGELDDERTLRVCEALDNSKFAYFGSKFDIEHRLAFFRALFKSEPVKRSLSDFLVRGGLVFFSPLTWTQLNSWPQEMKSFFAERGVDIPNGLNCKNTSSVANVEYQVVAKVTEAFKGSMFEGSRKCEPIKAIRHFGELPACWKSVYVSEKEGWPVMVVADCTGGGRVVFSHVFSVDRVAVSPFYLNLLEGLYGTEAVRIKSSRTAYLEDAKRRGLAGLHIRQVPALTRLLADSRLEDDLAKAGELKGISLVLARNDRELAQVALYNCTTENLMLRLEPDKDNPMHDVFAFYDVLPWMATNEQVYNEIVSGLNAASVISVPAGETKVFLLAAKTDRAPGTFTWSFSLVPVNFGEMKPRRISVKVEVLDLRLEERDLPDVYTFGPYGSAFRECTRQECWSFLAENHVNIMQIGEGPNEAISKGADGKAVLSEKDADYLSCEAELQSKGLKWVYGYRVVRSFRDRLKALGMDDSWQNPETKELFRAWVGRWSQALKGANVDFGRFWASIEDEPRTPQIPDLVEAAKILKAAGLRPTVTIATWGVQEDFELLKDVIELWLPWEARYTRRPDTAPAELAFLKKTGRPFLPYLCSISCAINPYLDYFRFRGMRSHLMGADGIAMWAANSWRGNDYYAPDDVKKCSACLFHHGDKPVGTMRLEMFREGIEDLYWLRRAGASGKPEAVRLVGREELERVMAADDATKVLEWRERLLRALTK